MKHTLLILLNILLFTGCEQREVLSESERMDSRGLALSISLPNTLSIDLMKNMKLLYFRISYVNSVKQYAYEGYYDMSDIVYNSATNTWTKNIPSVAARTVGVMVVAQENITSNYSYLLPAAGQGKEAALVNLTAVSSSITSGMVYGDAPGVFASDMADIQWDLNETTKNLNFSIMRVVGKLMITINDHDNIQTKDIYFKISNTTTSCNYGINYSGSTTITIPQIVKVDKTSKQGIAYLLPTFGSNSFVIEPVNPALKLTITTPLVIGRNKITEVTIDYHGTLNMTASGTLKDWTDVTTPELDCFDVSDSEGIGYKVINVGGILWFDRDLGAKYAIPRKSTSSLAADLLSDDDWGYLFQFGRQRDTHQKRGTAARAGVLTTVSDATKPWFVYGTNNASWIQINAQQSNIVPLWINPNQTNNPCPPGFRVPTPNELKVLYSQLDYDATLQGYYVDGIRKGKTTRMYLFGTTTRSSKDGAISPLSSNKALFYWTSSSRWGVGLSIFFVTLPTIQFQSNRIVLGLDTEYPAAMGFNVRCVYDKSSEIAH